MPASKKLDPTPVSLMKRWMANRNDGAAGEVRLGMYSEIVGRDKGEVADIQNTSDGDVV
jgi:hypothetical protein